MHAKWIIGASLAALALYLALRPGEPPAPPPEKPEPDLFAFVRSMEGTRPDGNVTVATGDKLVVDAGTDRVLGVHMIGPDSPEILQTAAIAVRAGLTKADFDATVALHPSMAEELVLLK